MTPKVFRTYLSILMATLAVNTAQAAPTDTITVAGGLTLIPLMVKAGEQTAAKAPQFKPPQMLNNPTGVGFKLFCSGSGLDSPSINAGTRAIKPEELDLCHKNGVDHIIEVGLGRDALVIAQANGGRLNHLTRKDLFLAVAKDVPDPKDNTKLIPNPYKS